MSSLNIAVKVQVDRGQFLQPKNEPIPLMKKMPTGIPNFPIMILILARHQRLRLG
jgi:hypothetical protein